MFVRGSNPIWSFVDLTGLQLDDTYYIFFLQNTIPYLPQPVYQTPSGIQWPDPLQMLANGTLPDNIYFDPGTDSAPNVYRLEIRKGNAQSDPLIYLIENYIPSDAGGGNTPGDIGFTTENQISNAQFSRVNFSNGFTFTSNSAATLNIAPGWSLVLGNPSGTGSITLNQVALNDDPAAINPTNAPYALEITNSGWSSVTLVQQFTQNGMLWTTNGNSQEYVAFSVTTQTQGPLGFISAFLVDSNNTNLGTLLASTQVPNSWNEFVGHLKTPATTNPNLPPAAYIQLRVQFTPNVNFYVSSFQLVNSTLDLNFAYEEDTIERQVDHLFHYYEPQLKFKPIPSYLVGWDFPLNPAQLNGPSVGTQNIGNNTSYYAWDQTIIFQSVTNSVSVSRSSPVGYLQLQASGNTQMAVIQYLTGAQMQDILVQALSGLSVSVRMQSTISQVMSVSLWWTANASLPMIGSAASVVSSLDANGHPTAVAGWNEIKIPLQNGLFNTLNSMGLSDFNLAGFIDPSAYMTATYFAIVVGSSLVSSGNVLNFGSISLTPGMIPTIPAPQSIDEVLRECQYYYETSYSSLADFNANPGNNPVWLLQQVTLNTTNKLFASPGSVFYKVSKRTNPNLTIYSLAKTSGSVSAIIYGDAAGSVDQIGPTDKSLSLWNSVVKNNAFYITPNSVTALLTHNTVSSVFGSGAIVFHWVADARLGVV